MLRFRSIFILLFVATSLCAPGAFGQTLGAVLTGSAEVPPNSNPGFGNATVTFDETRQNITVTITVTGLGSPINNFHIHEAPPGTNGPVRVDLIGLGGTFVGGTMTGTFPIAADVAQRMLKNPATFYVNIHTEALPGGAVRGQLAFASGGTVTYAAELRPGNEVPPVPNSNAFGSTFVTFDSINNTIAFDLSSVGIANPTMAHIHRGVAGVNGPVIINFATSAGAFDDGRVHGAGPVATFASANLTPADLTNLGLEANAGGFYVNVHSALVPSGEIRGQLTAAKEYDIAIAGRVTNAQGQTYVTDVRIFNPSYSSRATALLEFFPAGLDPNTTANVSMAVDIAPRGTAVLDDVGGSGLNITGTTGALRVTSATSLAVTSRIYVDRRAEGLGTIGQFVPAQPRSTALRRGVMPNLANQADHSSGFRTNIGFFNPTQSDVTVRLELRDSSGALFGQSTVGLRALSQQQRSINSYFPALNLDAENEMTLSFDAGAPIFVYAAVNDNVSGDSVLIPAQPDSGVATEQ